MSVYERDLDLERKSVQEAFDEFPKFSDVPCELSSLDRLAKFLGKVERWEKRFVAQLQQKQKEQQGEWQKPYYKTWVCIEDLLKAFGIT